MSEKQSFDSNSNVLGSVPVFTGTRVPVQTLFDYLEQGKSLDTFLDRFPNVGRAEAMAVLQEKLQLDDINWSRRLKRENS